MFNFVCTLNHVRDWITKDTNLDEDLKKHALELTKSSDNIKSVNSMCNGAKHANYEEETIVSAGYGMGRFGVGNYGVGEVSLKIYRNGEKERVLDIAKAAIDDWENFFKNEEIRID